MTMQNISAVLDQEAESILTPEERQPCEVWTRVMGYFRPTASFNRGKQGEYHERKNFIEPRCN
jgi:anaerobic ribonucleoside-triphosphate reductase